MSSLLQLQRDAVSAALGDRSLIYFGLRGTEASSLLQIEQLHAVISMIAPPLDYDVDTVAYEFVTGRRVDADRFHIDHDAEETRLAFRQHLEPLVQRPGVIVPYSPTMFIEDIALASEGTEMTGNPRRLQTVFDHKPWVEAQLRRLGIPTVEQRYVTAIDLRLQPPALSSGKVLRPSVSSGGEGLYVARSSAEVEEFAWRADAESVVSISEYFENAIPINIGGVVWPDGSVTVHPTSIQLIGIANCTDKPLGFCGNDFAAAALLPNEAMAEARRWCRLIGRWMHRYGYRGAFGIDALVTGDDLHFLEINPRLQGSSELSSTLVEQHERPGIILEHVAASFGLMPTASPQQVYQDQDHELDPASQLVVHHTTKLMKTKRDSAPTKAPNTAPPKIDLLHGPAIAADPGAIIARLRFTSSISPSGRRLSADGQLHLNRWFATVEASDAMPVS